MTHNKINEDEAFRNLQNILNGIKEQLERERTAQRNAFFDYIPKDAKSLYIHLSAKLQGHPFVKEIQDNYGTDNVLVTIAPPKSGQSFYDDSLDKIAAEEKRKRVIEPFEKFSANKSIDAIIYLCHYLCDGYQSPIFPEDVVTEWHIWRPIKLSEQLQKPFIIGYQDPFCFSVKCYERECVTKPEKSNLIKLVGI